MELLHKNNIFGYAARIGWNDLHKNNIFDYAARIGWDDLHKNYIFNCMLRELLSKIQNYGKNKKLDSAKKQRWKYTV